MRCPKWARKEMSASEKLQSLGYVVNKDLKLEDARSGEPYSFVKESYDEVADAVAEVIHEKMQGAPYHMEKVNLPSQSILKKEVRAPVYLSPNAYEATTLLVLLCGSGSVSAGQWSRRLCINVLSIDIYADWAHTQNMAVLVLNPNTYRQKVERSKRKSKGKRKVPAHPDAHVRHAWDFIRTKMSNIQKIAMVAHSYGGVQTCLLLEYGGQGLLQRLQCVAFTDSVHSSDHIESLPVHAQHFLTHKCINWATSSKNLNTPLESPFPPISHFKPEKAAQSLLVKKGGGSSAAGPEEEAAPPTWFAAMGEGEIVEVSRGGKTQLFEVWHDNTAKNNEAIVDKEEQDRSRKGKAIMVESPSSDHDEEVDELPPMKPQPPMEQQPSTNESYRCFVLSAGTTVHERTTMSAFRPICEFIEYVMKRLEHCSTYDTIVPV
ncbi:hypothetical protein SELMODRAFT_420845 [Selaginella moellendorffii]|uniref:Arb2 domain-containing protein n=1 Tax=Selaginella moellendorffii TaxID=88036 RepID=D8SDB0_SELML|nr:hypothetical protein SELMODRAFT_420845 [Selaginella moellendorffii]